MMTLEPCPVCESDCLLLNTDIPEITRVVCILKGCQYSGPYNDFDGSKHNKLSLNARLGQMVKEDKLKIGRDLEKFWWCLSTYGEAGKRGFHDTMDDLIRDAWRTLREGK